MKTFDVTVQVAWVVIGLSIAAKGVQMILTTGNK